MAPTTSCARDAADAGSAHREPDTHRGHPLLALARSLVGVDHLAITLSGPTPASAVLTSGHRERLVHNAELVAGEGPGHDVLTCGEVWTDAADVRWPIFGRMAAAFGVTSVAAVPLSSAGGPLGSLTAYGSGDVPAPPVGRMRQAAAALTQALLGSAAGSMHELDVRSEVHQATGIIANQLGCPVDAAALLLRARSFSTGVDIELFARDVVAGRVRVDAG